MKVAKSPIKQEMIQEDFTRLVFPKQNMNKEENIELMKKILIEAAFNQLQTELPEEEFFDI